MTKNKVILKEKKSKFLSKADIINIIKLKKSHWNYSISSQIKWFKKNSFKNDLHFQLFKDKKLIGYVHLGLRLFTYNSKKKKYILFRNLIIKKNERNNNYSSIIMLKVNKYIKKSKKIGSLLCKKRVIKFYNKYQWNILNKKNSTVIDHDMKNMRLMVFNIKKIKNLQFYYNK